LINRTSDLTIVLHFGQAGYVRNKIDLNSFFGYGIYSYEKTGKKNLHDILFELAVIGLIIYYFYHFFIVKNYFIQGQRIKIIEQTNELKN
jgi:hypothetical protein